MAAKPNEPPMQLLRKWLAILEEAIAKDDRVTIRAVLKDAVPEFDRTLPSQLLARAPRGRFESQDAQSGKSRHRHPALPAGPEHDSGDHGGDIRPSRAARPGPRAIGVAGSARQDTFAAGEWISAAARWINAPLAGISSDSRPAATA